MEILNSNLTDLPKIFGLYRVATEYMKSKNHKTIKHENSKR